MRILIIGAGGFGSNWWNHLPQRPEMEVVGLVDPVSAALEQAGAALKVPAARHFSNIEDALEKVEADLALHNTPPKHRPAHLPLLFDRGIHVLAAKPLTETLGEAKTVIKLAQEKGCTLAVNQQLRYGPVPRALQKFLQEGAVGKIDNITFDFHQRRGWTDRLKDVPSPMLVESSVHHFDFIRSVVGANPSQIFAEAWHPEDLEVQGETAAWVIFRMENGCRINYRGSRSGRTDLDASLNIGWYGIWRIEGTQGVIYGSEKDGFRINGEQFLSPQEATTNAGVNDLCGVLLDDVVQNIEAGETPETCGADNLWTMATCAAAFSSYQRETWVDVPALIEAAE